VLQQPSQAQTEEPEDVATDKLCLNEIKIPRIVPSEAQGLKLRVNKNISVFELFLAQMKQLAIGTCHDVIFESKVKLSP